MPVFVNTMYMDFMLLPHINYAFSVVTCIVYIILYELASGKYYNYTIFYTKTKKYDGGIIQ